MRPFICYLSFMLLITIGCTKDKPEEIPEKTEKPEKPDPEKPDDSDETDDPEEPIERYTERTQRFSRSEHYLASDADEDWYLGKAWHLKDTADNIFIEDLGIEYEPFDTWYFDSGTAIQPTQKKPSYETMKDLVYTYAKKSQSTGLNFQSTSFSDYAEIKRWLPDNIDRQHFLELA